MDYPLPPEQRDLQARIRRFVADELDALAQGVDPENIPADVRKSVASRSEAAGLRRLALPPHGHPSGLLTGDGLLGLPAGRRLSDLPAGDGLFDVADDAFVPL